MIILVSQDAAYKFLHLTQSSFSGWSSIPFSKYLIYIENILMANTCSEHTVSIVTRTGNMMLMSINDILFFFMNGERIINYKKEREIFSLFERE